MRKLIVGIFVLVVIAGGAYVAFGRPGKSPFASQTTTEAAPILPAVEADNNVVADAVVVPVQHVALSMPTGGIAAEVLVSEGERVEVGQVLIRLNSAQQAAAVAQARANVAGAEAQLAKAQAGPDPEDVAAVEAAVEVARAGVQTAEGAVASAEANLSKLRAGPTDQEIAIAQRRVEQAKNALWGAQTLRDGICGRASSGVAAAADCRNARAVVQQSEEAVRITELELQQVQSGPRLEDLAAAQAQLQQALGQLATAQAQVRQAEAELARVKKEPSAEDISVAEAQVAQAQAALSQAQVALADAELAAPMAGTVALLDVKVGEQVIPGTPIVRLADLSTWQIETDDLTELSVVNISEGDPVAMAIDAIPELELAGSVMRIKTIGQSKQGDITYTVIIQPDRQDPRLRWNMTAVVTIKPKNSE
ncbi:MAG: HlyD family secretion protein [Anaerolineae bacterium]